MISPDIHMLVKVITTEWWTDHDTFFLKLQHYFLFGIIIVKKKKKKDYSIKFKYIWILEF